MRQPTWWEGKINAGNVVSWIIVLSSTIYMVAFMRADVNALQQFKDEAKAEMLRFREQRSADREAIVEMRQDVRYIRQLLERGDRRREPVQ